MISSDKITSFWKILEEIIFFNIANGTNGIRKA